MLVYVYGYINVHVSPPSPPSLSPLSPSHQLEVKSLSVCLIDDSMNRDVPLLDLSLSTVQVSHIATYMYMYMCIHCISAGITYSNLHVHVHTLY